MANSRSRVNDSKLQEDFERLGFAEAALELQVGDWKLHYFQKQRSTSVQFVSSGDSWLIITGSLVRKGMKHNEGLLKTLEELNEGKLQQHEIFGSYALIFVKGGEIQIYLDPSNLQNVYSDSQQRCFSSSFLALQWQLKEVTFNKQAAVENLISGSLIGPQTLINEIKRIEPSEEVKLEGLKIRHLPFGRVEGFFKGSYSEAIEYQVELLEKLMMDMKPFADEQGVDSGLTSGHDSRLILALMRKHWNNYQVHSHYRVGNSLEVDIARELASEVGVGLVQKQVRDHWALSDVEQEEVFEESYLFCDGIIRMHGYWMEEYNTGDYRARVLGSKNLGVSGIGGEQYRNSEHLIRLNRDLRKWIEYHLLLLAGGNAFKQDKFRQSTVDQMEDKIRKKLGLSPDAKATKLDLKRYLNEVFIPSRLGGRNNVENKLSFYISPFVESSISRRAYEVIPHLGPSLQFQEDMIKFIDPELAKVRSDYGFNFYDGEPLKSKVQGVVKDFIPYSVLLKRLEKKYSNPMPEMAELRKSSFINKLIRNVEEAELGIDPDMIMRRPSTMPLVLDLGYFIEKMDNA